MSKVYELNEARSVQVRIKGRGGYKFVAIDVGAHTLEFDKAGALEFAEMIRETAEDLPNESVL